MQRFSLFLTAILLGTAFALVSAISTGNDAPSSSSSKSSHAPIFTFNNGIVEEGKSCAHGEWNRIKDIVGNAILVPSAAPSTTNTTKSHVRRGLRSTTTTTTTDADMASSLHQRQLLRCSDCGGRPLCLQSIGLGCAKRSFRRELHKESTSNSGPSNKAGSSNMCSKQVTAVNAALSAAMSVKNDWTASCRKLIMASPRTVECMEFTHNCDILGFNVIKVKTGEKNVTAQPDVIAKLSANNNNGTTSFCSSIGEITIEADTNFDLGTVTWELTGLNHTYAFARLDYRVPYTVFGDNASERYISTNRMQIKGIESNVKLEQLEPGEYTVRAYSHDKPSSGKAVTFTVKNC